MIYPTTINLKMRRTLLARRVLQHAISSMSSMGSQVSHRRPFVFSAARGSWEELQPPPETALKPAAPTQIHLVSWNVDFSQPYVDQRCVAAVEILRRHLARPADPLHRDSYAPPESESPRFQLLSEVPSAPTTGAFASDVEPDITRSESDAPPVVIQLQEVEGDGLEPLLEHPWLRRHFLATDIDAQRLGRYFTVTFLDRRLAAHLGAIERMRYTASQMGRDALCVDVRMHGGGVLRLANTHLESLDLRPPRRPAQLAAVAEYLSAEGAAGGVVAGDFNPVSAGDDELPAQVGLVDLWAPPDAAADVGVEEREQHTWGHWPGERPWPPRRMDKICASGRARLAQGRVARVGVGAKCIVQETVPLTVPVFVSDHCALEAYLTLAPEDA